MNTTVEEIKANKGFHRTFLQGLGTEARFDEGGYVEQCLLEQGVDPQVYYSSPYPPASKALVDSIVFDNIRTQAQLDILKLYGFRLARVWVPFYLQIERAAQQGVSETAMAAAANHEIERQLPFQDGEIEVNMSGSPVQAAQELVDALRRTTPLTQEAA